ncbi:hypothetical protein SYNTR_0920 [Candidatus Syntrophocurvum alkaliphilum]|uniref:Uncharacterized protein n=2 Tax=Candidatus Syntrophocurvum alkaliphilum TaxID=2293317 RepID=A0A6I6DGQ8_9FIRM|nr:hypothetical protein SYNTR_0920 [Candidatus Syntrophocurvum alkaliphilum]
MVVSCKIAKSGCSNNCYTINSKNRGGELMDKKQISDKQFINCYRSAGLWFVALYMEAFILRINELKDSVSKTKFIEEIYNDGDNEFDKEISATRTRVNCLLRIIESGRAIEALEVVVNSKLNKQFPEAVYEAEKLSRRIRNGEIIIPT